MKNFKNISEDYDRYESVRELVGRVTDKRIQAVDSFIMTFNEDNRYPYGQGYSCGHIHDCCGCLSSSYMSFEVTDNSIKIYHTENYNY
jgi:hypothetical protein